ncbi:hypothetical protein V8E52_006132 [Russula decolorans]
MLEVGWKYNLTFSTIRLSPQLKEQLPAWYHPGTECNPSPKQVAKCLIVNHDAIAITDLIRISNRLRNPPLPRPHMPSAWCICHHKNSGCPMQATLEKDIYDSTPLCG